MIRISKTLYRRCNETMDQAAQLVNHPHKPVDPSVPKDATSRTKASPHPVPIAWGDTSGSSCISSLAIEQMNDEKSGDDADESACLACMEHPPDAVLIECGHGGLCAACAGRLWREGPSRRRCPLCRRRFAGIVQIVGRAADKVREGIDLSNEHLESIADSLKNLETDWK